MLYVQRLLIVSSAMPLREKSRGILLGSTGFTSYRVLSKVWLDRCRLYIFPGLPYTPVPAYWRNPGHDSGYFSTSLPVTRRCRDSLGSVSQHHPCCHHDGREVCIRLVAWIAHDDCVTAVGTVTLTTSSMYFADAGPLRSRRVAEGVGDVIDDTGFQVF